MVASSRVATMLAHLRRGRSHSHTWRRWRSRPARGAGRSNYAVMWSHFEGDGRSDASVTRRPKSPSDDDAAMVTGFIGVFREVLVGFEVQVALDRKSELATDRTQLGQRDVAEFRTAEAEIAESEGELPVVVELCE